MPDEVLTFTFPMPVNLANSRMHWRVKENHRQAFYAMCDLLLKGKIFPKPPKTPWEKSTIASRMVLGGAMDDSNAMARHKWIEDWLRDRRYIVDDNKKHLKWAGFPEQRVSRKNSPEVEITLTRVA